MNKCKNCGHEFEGKFCSACGEPREEDLATANTQSTEAPVGNMSYSPLEARIIKDGVKRAWGYSSKSERVVSWIMDVGSLLLIVVMILLTEAIRYWYKWIDGNIVTKLLELKDYRSTVTTYLAVCVPCYLVGNIFLNCRFLYEQKKISKWISHNNIDAVKLINDSICSTTKNAEFVVSKQYLYCANHISRDKRFKNAFIVNCVCSIVAAMLMGVLLYFAILDFSEEEIIIGLIDRTKMIVLIVCSVVIAIAGCISKGIVLRRIVFVKEKDIDEWAKSKVGSQAKQTIKSKY